MKPSCDLFLRLSAGLPVAAVAAGLACGVLSLVVSGPADPPSPQSDEWYVKGNQLTAEHRLDEAIEAFQTAQRLSPRKPDSFFALGMIWLQKEDWRQAESSFAGYLRLRPKRDDVWLLLGKCRQQAGDIPGAITAFQNAQRLNPRNTDSYFVLGMLWLQKRDWPQAESSFSDYTRRSPGNADGWLLLGRCREQLGHATPAKEAYLKAVNLNPTLAEAQGALLRLSHK
jgi:cytochrome c-type biogenesis protein CcmH/NrfG